MIHRYLAVEAPFCSSVLFDFVVDRATKNPALADTISSMFTDLDLRARLKKPGFYMDLLLGRTLTP
jgi:hypothetical protein